MLEEKLNLYKKEINKQLKKIILKLKNKDCKYVCDAMEYSLIGGGKLIRPILTLAVCEMFNRNFTYALNFAAAIEFIHVGSLIHDDLPCMDDDYKRRGKDSCHIKYNETTAVLAGDAFICSAFEILTYSKEYGVLDEDIVKAVIFLSKMFGTKGTIAGQDLDMFLETEKIDFKMVEKIAKYKTSCLIRAACCLGAIASKADSNSIKIIDEYAQYLGIFFQICDDILDYKTERIKKEQANFVFVCGIEKAKSLAQKYYNLSLKCLLNFKNSHILKKLTELIFLRKT